MKLFRKLAAAALAGVMALSLLTGCALGDAAKENAMLKALQTVGDLYQVKVSESDSLSKKAIAKDNSADADYLRAVIAVKEGDMKSAEAQLKSATSKNPELAKKAAKDVNLKALKK